MKLKVKILNWSAGIPVAMLREKTSIKIGVHAQDRILIKLDHTKDFITILDTVKAGLIKENEIAVSSEIKDALNLKKGQYVDVVIPPIPASMDFIKKKFNGNSLSQKEIKEIIKDIVDNSLAESETALFVSAMHKQGMSFKEIIYLIKAILETGEKLNLKNKYVADKHSIGGIAGNRTTPIIVAICASAGLIMPKTSSRAITSAAGTADVIETIANVDFSIKEVKKIIKKTNACLTWGGGLGMVPADSKIIHVEKQLKIDPEAQLLASITAKKLALGSKYVLIDIPYGKSAKVSKSKANKLKKKFEKIGKYFKLKLKVVLTDGSQPMGNGVGPALELIDVIEVLNPEKTGPQDLKDKSLFLAGEILEMTNKAKKGKGIILAEEILQSGKAFEKFKEIIKAQGGSLDFDKIQPAKFKKAILAHKSGKISEIHNKKINSLARVAGCPKDKFAGLIIDVSLKDKVKKKQRLLTIYSETKSRLNEAVKFYKKTKPITIG